MRRDLEPDAPRVCHSCITKEKQRKKPKEISMNTMQFIVKCTQEEHAHIEETCMNQGKNYNEYFIGLHNLNTQKEFLVKEEKVIEDLSIEEEKEDCIIEINDDQDEKLPAKKIKKGKR